MRYHYFPVPDDIARKIIDSGTKRVHVTINGKMFKRAIQSSKSAPCIVVGRSVLREAGVALGDVVACTVRPDPDHDVVDIGEELSEVLRQDTEASARFYEMTPGRQRSLAYYVTSAKRPDTRVKRAVELARKLRTRTLYSDGPG